MDSMSIKIVLAVVAAAVVGGVVLYNWKSFEEPKGETKLRLVNVLDKPLYDDAHIKGTKNVESICVPFMELEASVKNWDKTTPVVTYCANYQCTASGSAAKKLKELGFTDVWAYEGGTAEWYQLGKKDSSYAIVGPAKQGYLEGAIKKPTQHEEGVQEITAAELQKKIKEATI